MAARLTGAMLLVRNVARSVAFFGEGGLGLTILRQSDEVAQLASPAAAAPPAAPPAAHGPPVLTVQAVAAGSEAPLSVGFSPMLTFEVADMDETVPRLLMLGAHLDGAIKYAPHGKVASVRSPDGMMIGLYEPAAAAPGSGV